MLYKDVSRTLPSRIAGGKLRLGLATEHLGCKLISPAGNGHNQRGLLPQCAAQLGDVLGQVAFFYIRAGPNGLKDFLLGHHPPRVHRQEGEHIKGLRRERYRRIQVRQDPLAKVKAIVIEAN
jgi:hypothetical protein